MFVCHMLASVDGKIDETIYEQPGVFRRIKKESKQWKRISASAKLFLEEHYLDQSHQLLQRRNVQKNILVMLGSILMIGLINKVTWFFPALPSADYTKNCKGILESVRKILVYYMQPKMTVSKYFILEEWNMLSIVISFGFVVSFLVFVVWRRQCVRHSGKSG